MATIFFRLSKSGNKKYYGNLTVNGNRVKRYLADDLKTAKINLNKLEYNLTLGNSKFIKNQSIFLDKAILSFLKEVETSGVKYDQVYIIKKKLSKFSEYCLTKNITTIQQIQVSLAKDYVIYRSNDRITNKYLSNDDNYCPKIAPRTLNREVQFLKRFFNYALEVEWIDKNPFNSVKAIPLKPNGQRYHFTPEQLDSIMANAGKFYDIYYLLVHTGIRCTDAYKLKPEHFDGNYLKVQMNKTGDFLNIPIPRHVLEVLEPRMANSTLFPLLSSDRQRRNCVKNIQRLFEPDFVRNNNINLHTFRHTYAHNMLNKGVPKEVLQTLLGHRSIKTTEIYANWVRKEELERWV
jgi:site-specific recombinase XerD